MPDQDLILLAEKLGRVLLQRRLKVATAESCTGGWIAQSITAVAGSSQWFTGGFVCYSNECKQSMLQVSGETIRSYGAVSEEVVKELAAGAIANTDAQLSIAVSGIAGPDGGTPQKPVGTVWVAWALPDARVMARCYTFAGDRYEVRRATVIRGIEELLEHLQAVK